MRKPFSFALAILALAFLESPVARADCVNVGGLYRLSQNIFIKLEQEGCRQLTRSLGLLTVDGSIKFTVKEVFPLDGSPICDSKSNCESATPRAGGIAFSRSYIQPIQAPPHGRCSARSSILSKDPVGNLVETYQVYGCSNDGYSGNFPTTVKVAAEGLKLWDCSIRQRYMSLLIAGDPVRCNDYRSFCPFRSFKGIVEAGESNESAQTAALLQFRGEFPESFRGEQGGTFIKLYRPEISCVELRK